ncbi:glycosyltransferase family 4 protein [Crocinitomix catalasitica]|uniref:glycosyltransferase family 4 protein n=1 Tax=Crocinitomix catalasitica TaxID=184607 RepID=UPI00047F1A3D|nr:MraY family glycosyltransferase [Crocinitomix catalasitica]
MENLNVIYLLIPGVLVSSLLLAFWFYPKYIAFLKVRNLMDIPDFRKHHIAPIPSSGGLVFGLLSLIGAYFLMQHSSLVIPYLCSLVLLMIGFIDDRKDLTAKTKFLFQIIAAVLTINYIGVVPVFSDASFIGNYMITFFFIIGFTNAFNLIDGVDGLAGTFAVFVLVIFVAILAIGSDFNTLLYVLSLLGGVLAFLKFNLKNAKIFMGDTGSLFLGFTIAFLSLHIVQSKSIFKAMGMDTEFIVLIIAALLLLPVLDTLRVMFKRITHKKSPFQADRTHLHHILGNCGFNSVKIALTFVSLSALFLILTFTLIQLEFTFVNVLIMLIIAAIVCYGVIFNHYIKVHANRVAAYYDEVLEVNENKTYRLMELNKQMSLGVLKKSS